jgi:hypothetical protein
MIALGEEPDMEIYPIVQDMIDHTLHQSLTDDTYYVLCRKPNFQDKTARIIATMKIFQKDEIYYIEVLQLEKSGYWKNDFTYDKVIEKVILLCVCNLKWYSLVLVNNGIPSTLQSIKYMSENYNDLGFEKYWYDLKTGFREKHSGYPDIPENKQDWSILIKNYKDVEPLIAPQPNLHEMFYEYEVLTKVYAPHVLSAGGYAIGQLFNPLDPDIVEILQKYSLSPKDHYKPFLLDYRYLNCLLDHQGNVLIETYIQDNFSKELNNYAIVKDKVCLYGHQAVYNAFFNKRHIYIIDLSDGPWVPVGP